MLTGIQFVFEIMLHVIVRNKHVRNANKLGKFI